MWRHGDVLVEAVEKIPADARRVPGVVLARGEATGHAHRIAKPETAQLYRSGDTLFLKVVAPSAQLIHEEHSTIDLPQGCYRYWMQREYSPEAIRRVVD